MTPSPAWAIWIGSLVRKWAVYSLIVVALFVLTMALRAIWEPLGWAVTIGATVLLVYLLYRGLTGRW